MSELEDANVLLKMFNSYHKNSYLKVKPSGLVLFIGAGISKHELEEVWTLFPDSVIIIQSFDFERIAISLRRKPT